nr:hypothetical protein [uncultured bacterium]
MPSPSRMPNHEEGSARKQTRPELPPLSAPLAAGRSQPSVNTAALTPQSVLALQRTAGNQAVNRLLQTSSPSSTTRSAMPVIQTKLKVGPVDDAYEQEADRIADQVVRQPAAQPSVQREDTVQRQEDEEELLQMKPAGNLIQRQDDEDEDDDFEDEEFEEDEFEDRYQPTAKELRKEMGRAKVLGWRALHKGARGVDWAKSLFPHRTSGGLRSRVERGFVNSASKANTRLYNKHSRKHLSRAERRQLRKEDKQSRKEDKALKKAMKKDDWGAAVNI